MLRLLVVILTTTFIACTHSFKISISQKGLPECSYSEIASASQFQILKRNVSSSVSVHTSDRGRYEVEQCASRLSLQIKFTNCVNNYLQLIVAKPSTQKEHSANICKVPMLDPLKWPRDKTIWFVGDSVFHQIFRSIICQIADARAAGSYTISYPYGKKDGGVYCFELFEHTFEGRWHSANASGKVCMYFAGCLSGSCFRAECPHRLSSTLPKRIARRQHKSCIFEISNLTRAADVVFIGLNAHFREDEAAQVMLDLELFKEYANSVSSRTVVHWLSTTAQHFPSKTCRLNSTLAVKGGGCRMCNHVTYTSIIDSLAKQTLANETAVASFVPLNLASQPAWPATHPPKAGQDLHILQDCTHYCMPGVPDILSDVIFAALMDGQPK
mmetsp:Transcript_38080/g.64006  ORF Transcript_38080/g.64006 Transcript_38080/m.64006 type:complete len:385 (-) Transcript_38080:1143-2297(-)